MKKRIITTLTLSSMFLIGACAGLGGAGASNNQTMEFRTQDKIATNYNNNQPIPIFPYSQIRQNLKELEKAQAEGVQTTTFECPGMGCDKANPPMKVCPSIGAPIPVTDSLTNPEQPLRDNSQPLNNGGGNVTVQQMEPTGVYPGQGAGTYVLCVGADGKIFPSYWEGNVAVEFGPAKWDDATGQIVDVGPASFTFTKNQQEAGVGNASTTNPNH